MLSIEEQARIVRSNTLSLVRQHLEVHASTLNAMRASDPAIRDDAPIEALYRNPELGGERMRVRMMKFEESLMTIREQLSCEYGHDERMGSVVNMALEYAFEKTNIGEWVELANMSNAERENEYKRINTDVYQVNGLR